MPEPKPDSTPPGTGGQSAQRFQFFNDGAQWKQVDKAGHFYSAFHLSQIMTTALQQAAVEPRQRQYYGSLAGWLLLVPIEVFDGFSEAYGFSWQDLAANAPGVSLFVGAVRVVGRSAYTSQILFSSHGLGSRAAQHPGQHPGPKNVLKDYNGQTYWLSVDFA